MAEIDGRDFPAVFAAILLPNFLPRGSTRQYFRHKVPGMRRTRCSKNVSGNIEQHGGPHPFKVEITSSNLVRGTNFRQNKRDLW